ncbi:MAG: EAL domain-containing protein [Deltaproteobacteria bacterium]|nr:EAL domain-containing protein [Deltaproteobacteria bacterium]
MAPKRLNWTVTDEDDVRPYDSTRPPGVRGVGRANLRVVYQPIVHVRTKRLAAVEALCRCDHPGFANPSVLFSEAAAAGYSGRLGRIIRELAFEEASGQRIFVNIHPSELAARWLVRPDDPMFLHDADVFLEITEAAAFEHHDLVRAVLSEVSSRGVRLVIDDFGAGYSNLARLADLHPAVVKVDRSLVTDLDRLPRQQTLLRHIVAMMQSFEATVVVEGVETVDELRAVVDTGADFVQGYLLARPANPIPVPAWPSVV